MWASSIINCSQSSQNMTLKLVLEIVVNFVLLESKSISLYFLEMVTF